MTDTIETRTGMGTLRGIRTRGVCRFSGIPYAEAPVGDLRFRPPVSPRPWQGCLDATRPGAVAPQLPSRLEGAMGSFEARQSEDCLNLTVWTPAPDGARRPVLVWLHGGAWQSGGGALDWYDGAALAARGDIVVVALNYRLAALGWLMLPGEVANVGLLDQEAAIDWVVSHVEGFGGDPERITVMGQSAGAFLAACLLARKPRFDRAILMSASLGRGFRPAATARAQAEVFLTAAGLDSVEAARRADVGTLLEAQRSPAYRDAVIAEGAARAAFATVADGEVIDAAVSADVFQAAGRADVLIGHTKDELAAFPDAGRDEASRALGDRIYGESTRRWAARAQAQGRRAWAYQFDYGPTERFGACHCIELPFVFGTRDAFAAAPMLHGAGSPDVARLTAEIQRGWIDFVAGGSPGWGEWPACRVFA